MNKRYSLIELVVVSLLCAMSVCAQDAGSVPQSSTATDVAADLKVPRLVRFSGVLRDLAGKPLSGPVEIHFAIYGEQTDATPLWEEIQNLQVDEQGHYSVLLGATQPDGLPLALFATGQGRWLGVGVGKLSEQPRILFVSVPYALKAGDADTLGGKPATAFVASDQLKDQVRSEVKTQVTQSGSATRTLVGTAPTPQAMGEGQSSYTCNVAADCVAVTQSGAGNGLHATTPTGSAVLGEFTGTVGAAVYGRATAVTGAPSAVQGDAAAPNAVGVLGRSFGATGTSKGVFGRSFSNSGTGVHGDAPATSGATRGVWGSTTSTGGVGVWGQSSAVTGFTTGVTGTASSTTGVAVFGQEYAASGATIGVQGKVSSAAGTAIVADNVAGGKIFSGQNNGVEMFSVDGNGNVVAKGTSLNGPSVFTAVPTGTGVAQSTLYVNPASATLNYSLLGLAVGGVEKFRVDAEGDVYGRGAVFGGAVQYGVVGTGSSSGLSFGVQGNSDSTSGTAVRGDAGATSGQTFGVHGVDSADDGTGVFGVNNSSASVPGGFLIGPHGVRGEATNSPIGVGVSGIGGAVGLHGVTNAANTSGVAGLFQTKNNNGSKLLSGLNNLGAEVFSVTGFGSLTVSGLISSGRGVSSYVTAGDTGVSVGGGQTGVYATGSNYGLYGGGQTGVKGYNQTGGVGVEGQNNGDYAGGIGVLGNATFPITPGPTTGVKGTSASSTDGSTGVFGDATSASGATIGVHAKSDGSNGIGLLTEVTGNAFTTYAIKATAQSPFGAVISAVGSNGSAGIYAETDTDITGDFNRTGGFDTDPILQARVASNIRFKVLGNGNVYADGTFTGGGADFAEAMAVRGERDQYEPGDVLIIDPTGDRQLTLARQAYSSHVAGIYSTKPGMLGRPYSMDDPRLDQGIPLAVVGIVPCKVSAENGPIERGDLLVTAATPGHAMKGTDRTRMLGAVVGKALGQLHSGSGVIEVLVTLQ